MNRCWYFLVGLAACQSTQYNYEPDSLAGETLRVTLPVEPKTLNPLLDPQDAWSQKITSLVYQTLVKRDAVSPETFVGDLAASWFWSNDYLKLTLELRKNIQWHDGFPLLGEDIIFTLDEIFKPQAPTQSMRQSLGSLKNYTLKNPYTIELNLTTRDVYFLAALSTLFILPKHLYEKETLATALENRAPVGTGSYKFVEWQPGQAILLERVTTNSQKPYFKRISFLWLPELQTALTLAKLGDIDIIETITPNLWQQLQLDPIITKNYERLRHTPNAVQWLGFNSEHPKLQNKKLRQALSLLVDRQDVVEHLRYGQDTLISHWIVTEDQQKVMYEKQSLEKYSYEADTARAQKLLDDLGLFDSNQDGFREERGQVLTLVFSYPAGKPFYEQLGYLLKMDFQKQGIKLQLQPLEWSLFLDQLHKRNFMLCSLLWQTPPGADPLPLFHSRGRQQGLNFVGLNNHMIDRLLEQARTEFDHHKRNRIYEQFSHKLNQEFAYVFLFQRHNLSLIKKSISGIRFNYDGSFAYDELLSN